MCSGSQNYESQYQDHCKKLINYYLLQSIYCVPPGLSLSAIFSAIFEFTKIFFKSKASVKFLFDGRGLIAGCAMALKTMNPKIKMIAGN